MKSKFDMFFNRRSSDSIKWNLYDEDVLPLWVADSDFPAPESVVDEIQKRISHGIFGYAKPQDSTKAAIQDWLKKRHDWEVSFDDIVLIPGVVQGFNFTAAAFTHPGDSVLFQTPAYHPFFDVSVNNQLHCQIHQLAQDDSGKFIINIDEFEDCITPETRVFMLCNPQNPTGRVLSKSDLRDISRICLKNNILICSDEIHCDLVFEGSKHIPIASLSEEISHTTVTLISASKTFNLAGLKSSAVIISNPALRNQFQAKLKGLSGSTNIIGETAMRAAYSTGEFWLDEFLHYLEENRLLLTEYVQKELPGININPPEGTFLAWLDCTATQLDDPAEHFLNKAKVALNPGDWFGENFRKFARLNFACHRDVLISALDRIKNSLII